VSERERERQVCCVTQTCEKIGHVFSCYTVVYRIVLESASIFYCAPDIMSYLYVFVLLQL